MYGMPTLTNEVRTTNVIANFEAKRGKDLKTMFEEVLSDYRTAWDNALNPKVSISTDDLKAAISATRQAEDIGDPASRRTVAMSGQSIFESSDSMYRRPSASRRTLNAIMQGGLDAARVIKSRF